MTTTHPRSLAAAGLAASLLAMLWLVGPGAGPAAACSCMAAEEDQHFDNADAVFVGEVLDRVVAPLDQPGAEAVWTFGVGEVYKGDVTSVQEVRSSAFGASCGLEIEPLGNFVVFATTEGGSLTASLCGGTRAAELGPVAVDVEPVAPTPSGDADPVDDADDDGVGSGNGSAAGESGDGDGGAGWAPWVAGAAVVAAAGAGWFAVRRTRAA